MYHENLKNGEFFGCIQIKRSSDWSVSSQKERKLQAFVLEKLRKINVENSTNNHWLWIKNPIFSLKSYKIIVIFVLLSRTYMLMFFFLIYNMHLKVCYEQWIPAAFGLQSDFNPNRILNQIPNAVTTESLCLFEQTWKHIQKLRNFEILLHFVCWFYGLISSLAMNPLKCNLIPRSLVSFT